MKELARLKIRDADEKIKQMSSEELDEKFDFIYSLGYIYIPYLKEFFNPFINQGLKISVLYNLDLNRINNVHDSLKEDYLKNNKIKDIEEIKNEISNYNSSRLFLFLSSESVIFSFLFFILAIISNIIGQITFEIVTASICFILINSYIIYNLTFARNEDGYLLSPFWNKYQNILLIFSIIVYSYYYYILYNYLNSFFIPVIIIYSVRYLVKKYITDNLRIRYLHSAIYHL